ncbi:MAG: DUF4416 family protein [Chloroflexi bacterium]|jgi:hypothetical protein|nr:DUF4416 family protein [Chloroflexota bacterium]
MGAIKQPLPVKLVLPMISGHRELFQAAAEALAQRFGAVDYTSAVLPFTYTDYYDEEFGGGLLRQFVSFQPLMDPGKLAEVKVLTNELEEQWRADGRRRINLDPGYITQAKLVLATTKNYAHRLYIGQGIFAEVTLMYRDGDFRPLPWTYPDYQSEPYLEVLRAIRGIYVAQLKEWQAGI